MFCHRKRADHPWLRFFACLMAITAGLLAICTLIRKRRADELDRKLLDSDAYDEPKPSLKQSIEDYLESRKAKGARWIQQIQEEKDEVLNELSDLKKDFHSWKILHQEHEDVTLSFLFPDNAQACEFMNELASEGISSLLDEDHRIVDVLITGSSGQEEIEEALELIEQYCSQRNGSYQGFSFD